MRPRLSPARRPRKQSFDQAPDAYDVPTRDVTIRQLLVARARVVEVPVVEVSDARIGLARLVAGRAFEFRDVVRDADQTTVFTRRLVLDDDVLREGFGFRERREAAVERTETRAIAEARSEELARLTDGKRAEVDNRT